MARVGSKSARAFQYARTHPAATTAAVALAVGCSLRTARTARRRAGGEDDRSRKPSPVVEAARAFALENPGAKLREIASALGCGQMAACYGRSLARYPAYRRVRGPVAVMRDERPDSDSLGGRS